MKATELMIGDWVQDIGFVTIESICNEGICTYRNSEGYIYTANISNLKPIPLTKDTLEKNDFIKGEQVSDTPPYDEDEDGNKHYSIREGDKQIFWGWWQKDNSFLIPANGLGWITFKYVHELQHALKLCGIEKNIIV